MRGLFVLVSSLFDSIATLPFIPVSTVLQALCNFFDPHDELLKQLFKSQPVFPGLYFSSHLYTLQQCVLRDITSITGTDILQI